jgi:hypothetical protein
MLKVENPGIAVNQAGLVDKEDNAPFTFAIQPLQYCECFGPR